MKLYCAWSSFLQNWDRRIINKSYYYYLCQPSSEDIKQHLKKNAPYGEPVWPSGKALGW